MTNRVEIKGGNWPEEKINLSIRQTPKEGESFSSYLVRTARANYVSYLDIRKYARPDKTNRKYVASTSCFMNQVDWQPQSFNVHKMGAVLGLDMVTIECMTFTPVMDKYSSNWKQDTMRATLSLCKEIVRDRRRLCPECVSELGYFKLIWQVREINLCKKHLTPLISECTQCGKKINYVFEGMWDLECPHCRMPLKNEGNGNKDIDYHNELEKYKRWKFLLSPTQETIPTIKGLNFEQSLACILLYHSQATDRWEGYKAVSYLGRDTAKGLASLIRNPKSTTANKSKINLQQILKVTRKSGIELEELYNIKVPDQYVDSFLLTHMKLDNNEDICGPCLAPWCESYQSSDTIEELYNTSVGKKIRKKNIIHKKLFGCTKCFMRYGRNGDSEWTEIDGKIGVIWSEIKPCIEQGLTTSAILKKTGIHDIFLDVYIGYMIQHKLIDIDIIGFVEPVVYPKNLVELFKKLKICNFSNICTVPFYHSVLKKCKYTLGEDRIEVFYYAADKELNYKQLFENWDSTMDKSKKVELLTSQIEHVIESLTCEDEISIDKVASLAGCAKTTIMDRGFSKIIKEKKEKYKQHMLTKEKSHLEQMYLSYKENILLNNELLHVQRTVTHLNRSHQYLKRYHGELLIRIQLDSEIIKSQQKLEILKRLEREISRVVASIYLSRQKLTIQNVANEIGIRYHSTVLGSQINKMIRTEIKKARE